MIKWYPCEMHCHTMNSDGDFTVADLMKSAREYDFCGIALTDHNTTAGHRSVTPELESETVCVLKGIEWTTYFGHMLVTGCDAFVDWRDAVPGNIDTKTDEIKAYGGMIGIAHPFELGGPMCTGGFWEYNVHKWENIDYIEVWSKPFPASKSANERAMMMWNGLLDIGYHIAATYGKDWHRPVNEVVPSGCTYIGCENELSGDEIKKAVTRGRTSVTMGPSVTIFAQQGNRTIYSGDTFSPCESIELTVNVDMQTREKHWQKFGISVDEVRLVTNNGRILERKDYDGNTVKFNVNARKGWYRAEIWGKAAGLECEIGFTSPIYCE